MALQICLRMDEKFNKFEHNFNGLGMEMAELYREYAILKSEFCGQISLLENEMKKLRKENGILTSRLMNNAAEIYEQNLANIQSMALNNDITTIKREEGNVAEVSICPGSNAEQQHQIAPEQVVEPKQYYTTNPLDELNEISADGFGQIEEDGFDEGDEIISGNSMEMNGTRERIGDVFLNGNNLSPQEGPSNNGNVKNEDGRQQQQSKTKLKYVYSKKLICQWHGCGYRAPNNAIMQRHWRKHTGERPYRCLICGQSFTRSDHMKNHELTQHNLI